MQLLFIYFYTRFVCKDNLLQTSLKLKVQKIIYLQSKKNF